MSFLSLTLLSQFTGPVLSLSGLGKSSVGLSSFSKTCETRSEPLQYPAISTTWHQSSELETQHLRGKYSNYPGR